MSGEDPFRPPFVVRAMDRLADYAGRLGLSGLPLDRHVLERQAMADTGLRDFGDEAYVEPLEVLIESYASEAVLRAIGSIQVKVLLRRILVLRLRMVELRRREPQLATAPLSPPLVICGLPRSGTTFLHRLLALAPGAQGLPLYQLIDPLPGPGEDARTGRTNRRQNVLRTLMSKSVDAQHYVRPDLPDECVHLFKPSFLCTLFFCATPVYGYMRWYLEQDLLPAYRDYAFLLRALRDPNRRLTLKDPFHARRLPELLTVLPEARVVQLHRDPLEVIPSFNKLTFTLHAILSRRADRDRTARGNLGWLEDLAARSMRARATIPAAQLLDLRYTDLVRDPLAAVRRIHDFFDLEWSEDYERRLRRYIDAHPQREHGPNPYRIEDFGLTDEEICERFAEYRERFVLE